MESNQDWPHLESNELDFRFKIVKQQIDFENKHVVDFNCGKAGMANYVSNWLSYKANDVKNLNLSKRFKSPRIDFYLLDDIKFAGKIKRAPVDILLCFGMVIGYGKESKTQDKALRKIIKQSWPKKIVLEAVVEYDEQYGLIRGYVNGLKSKYSKIFEWTSEYNPKASLYRRIVILELK